MEQLDRYHLASTIQQIRDTLENNQENIDNFLLSQRLANIGNIVGEVAHTFNNILGGILGYSQLLKEELAAQTEAYRHATIIEQAAKRASKLILHLHLYSNRSQHYHIRPLDPKALVDEVAAILKSSVNRNIVIRTEYKHHSKNVAADFTSLCQALFNIGLNARDAMPNGGELSVATELAKEKSPQGGAAKEYVVFKIHDTGSGILGKNLPFIFEPFFTTKEKNVASGLGLTLAKAIVADHQGVIKVNSKIRKGTMVKVYIPARHPAGVSREPVASAEAKGNGEVIMVVDDEEDLRGLAKNIFERKGFNVLLAESGEQALELLEAQFQNIQLVILDVMLPRLGGEMVYQRLKQADWQPKIILTSGYTRHSPNLKFLYDSDECFIPKPWDVPELLNQVGRLFQQSGSGQSMGAN